MRITEPSAELAAILSETVAWAIQQAALEDEVDATDPWAGMSTGAVVDALLQANGRALSIVDLASMSGRERCAVAQALHRAQKKGRVRYDLTSKAWAGVWA